ncbi:MAG TPA: DUF2214 family protein [Candidatus Krumholzibacteria bacterium]|nr:DUF2214 family protein [Candidatus Krumholzibacteria bacterium]HRX52070.1 DUF2214 family protein [Candidatus Krumholzibacteria bacterium]
MTTELFVRMLHFVGILILTGALAVQNACLRPSLKPEELRRLARVDALYGASALLVLGAGLAMWLAVGKPKEFYSGNPLFHIKLTLFVVIFLLSLAPTMFFLKHRGAVGKAVAVPARIRVIKRVELALLVFLPLLAVLVARGVGLS